jgi:hypothetical protein
MARDTRKKESKLVETAEKFGWELKVSGCLIGEVTAEIIDRQQPHLRIKGDGIIYDCDYAGFSVDWVRAKIGEQVMSKSEKIYPNYQITPVAYNGHRHILTSQITSYSKII